MSKIDICLMCGGNIADEVCESGRWKPVGKETVFMLNNNGTVLEIYYGGARREAFERGLIFKTKEEAQAVDALRVFEAKHSYTLEEFKGVEFAWRVSGDNNNFGCECTVARDLVERDFVLNRHYPTKEIAQEKCDLLEALYKARQ